MKIVDDPNYELTEEDKANGVQLLLIEKGENGQIGHAYYKDKGSNEWRDDPNAKENDCVYGALGKIIKQSQNVDKSAVELRGQAAQWVRDNSASYGRVIAAENWIKSRYPESASQILLTAGLHRNILTGEIGLDEGDVRDLIQIIQSLITATVLLLQVCII